MIPPGTHIPRSVILRVFLSSMFLQASWNPKGMQNLGLAYALYPALEVLYPDPEARGEAVQRHLTFFNTHPYVAAAIVGGVLYHEERISKGEEDPSRVDEFSAPDGSAGGAGRRPFWPPSSPRWERSARRWCPGWGPGPRCSSWSSTTRCI
jgi:PTS system mannose-specific IID component